MNDPNAIPFNNDWKFLLGDPIRAESADYNDRTWKRVDLPHDWVISQPFKRGAEGYTPQNMQGYFAWEGICWYRKSFYMDGLGDNEALLYFGGAYRNSAVYVNGRKAGGRAYGYSSFELDITGFVKAGENIVALRLDNGCEPPDRWYSGSGLYRNVYLRLVPRLRIKTWGVRVKTKLVDKVARVMVDAAIVNHGVAAQGAARVCVYRADNALVAEAAVPFNTMSGTETAVRLELAIYNPLLWSADAPNLYRAEVWLEPVSDTGTTARQNAVPDTGDAARQNAVSDIGDVARQNVVSDTGDAARQNAVSDTGDVARRNMVSDTENAVSDTENAARQNVASDTGDVARRNMASDTGDVARQNMVSDTETVARRNAASDTEDVARQNAVPDTGNAVRQNVASDTGDVARQNAVSDTGNAVRQNVVSDTKNAMLQNAASDTETVARQNAVPDTGDAARQNAVSDTGDAARQNVVSDTGDAARQNVVSDTKNAMLQNAASDTGDVARQNAVPDTGDVARQNAVSDTGNAVRQNVVSDTKNAMLQNAASDTEDAARQNAVSDTKNAMLQNAASDTEDVARRNMASDTGDAAWQNVVSDTGDAAWQNVVSDTGNTARQNVVSDTKNAAPDTAIFIPFGIREIIIVPQQRMRVNGESVLLKGVCLHHDCGLLGSAYYDAAWRRRLLTLKSIGCNAIRTSHNPPAEEFLNLCDELGFYVIDECFDKWKSGYYEAHFDAEWQNDLDDFIMRDQNHPSVFLWSIGNEIHNQGEDAMLQLQKMLTDRVRAMDERPVTCALAPHVVPRSLVGAPLDVLVKRTKRLAQDVDVLGLNYHEALYQDYSAAINKPILGTECYEYYTSSASNFEDVFTKNPWRYVLENNNVLGQFIWAGIDYLGESSYPAKGWAGSILDICGFLKPNAYYRKSLWSAEPMVYLTFYDNSLKPDYTRGRWSFPKTASHLNFEHFRREMVKAAIYTNCDEVELLINGNLMGRRRPSDFENKIIEWVFEYPEGEIKTIAYQNGAPVCTYTLKTAGPARDILLTPDTTRLDAGDIAHIEVRAIDAAGVLCPTEDALVEFALSGDGVILGASSPDLNTSLGYTLPKVHLYGGRALLLIRAGASAGTLELAAYSERLRPAALCFNAAQPDCS